MKADTGRPSCAWLGLGLGLGFGLGLGLGLGLGFAVVGEDLDRLVDVLNGRGALRVRLGLGLGLGLANPNLTK